MSSFGIRLLRLLENKGVGAGAACQYRGLDLKPVIEGSEPSALLLERLAPMVGIHIQDMFVLAGLAVPAELTTLDPAAGASAINIAFATMSLTVEDNRRLGRIIDSLPQEERKKPASPLVPRGSDTGSFLLGMLENRNLAPHRTAKALYLGTKGRVYLSEVAVRNALVREGRLTSDQFTGFASVLGVPATDLAILTGFGQPLQNASKDPASMVAAELLWGLRRLTAQQARHIAEVARSMMGGDAVRSY